MIDSGSAVCEPSPVKHLIPSLHDAVMDRLDGWRSEPGRSILHSLFDDCDTRERLTTRRIQAQKGSLPFVMSSKGKKGEYMAFGTPSGITKEHLNKHFRDDSHWWSTVTIQSILEVVNQMVRTRTDGAVFRPSQPLVWQNNFCLRNLSGVFSSKSSSRAIHANNQCPLPSLGRDASWRSLNIISVVTPGDSNHFVTIAILGQLRLVVVYDGLGGRCDQSLIWTVHSFLYSRQTLSLRITQSLKENFTARLQWEVAHGLAVREESQGWIVAPNDPVSWNVSLTSGRSNKYDRPCVRGWSGSCRATITAADL